jgi:hypothetical protein
MCVRDLSCEKSCPLNKILDAFSGLHSWREIHQNIGAAKNSGSAFFVLLTAVFGASMRI